MKYRTVPGIISTRICEKYYLVTPEDSIEINETANFCWTLIEDGFSEDDIIQSVSSTYDIPDKDVLAGDIHIMLDIMLSRKLIVRSR